GTTTLSLFWAARTPPMSGFAHYLSVAAPLPGEGPAGALAGRVWLPAVEGPAVIAVRGDGVYDISARTASMRDLCEAPEPARIVREAKAVRLASLQEILSNTPLLTRDPAKPWLLAPIDLQAIKAAGVTFPRSLTQRGLAEDAR